MQADKKPFLFGLSRTWGTLHRTLIAVLLGLAFGAIVIAMAGENVLDVYSVMLKGSFGSPYYFTSTLSQATPIIFCGLAVAVAWRCGFATIGAEGQMICAGLSAAIAAGWFPGPPFVKVLAAFVAGCVAGCLYSLLAAVLLEKFKANLIISTLMLNYIAHYITFYLVEYVFKDAGAADRAAVQTAQLDEALWLPKLAEGYTLHAGFLVAILTALVLWFISGYTTFGYRTKMCGLNNEFARYGGINSRRMLYMTMAMSGMIAGLAAACEVLGTKHRYVNDMFRSPGYAWTGIVVALMANNNPLGIIFSSIFMAAVSIGSMAVERSTSIPVEVSSMIQGVITLFMSAHLIIRHIKKQRAQQAGGEGGGTEAAAPAPAEKEVGA